ncbi:MAG TPA: tetratricopeptide repeat protein [bacterium]|nr:tetratricopeptide repeat protein [bacterium]
MNAKDPSPFIAQGEERRAAGDLQGALDAFSSACGAAPASAHAHNKLGTCYVDLERWDDAFAEFSKAAQLDPRYAPAHSNLGNVYRERGRLDEAVACYHRAIAMDPEYWVAHQNLGVVFKQQGRIGDAVREFKAATRLSLRAPARGEPGAGARAPRGGRAGCLGSGSAMLMLVLAVFALARR